MYVLCMSHVCIMYVLGMSYVCLMYVSCMSYVCITYVSCMSHVCLMYVLCMSHVYVSFMFYVCLMYALCMSHVCLVCYVPDPPILASVSCSRKICHVLQTTLSSCLSCVCMYVCMSCVCVLCIGLMHTYIYTYISAFPILRHTIRHQLQFTHMPWASHIHNRPIVFTFSLGQPTHTKRTHIQNAPSS